MAWSQQRCMWVSTSGALLGAFALFTRAGLTLNLSGSRAMLVLLLVAAALAALRDRITAPLPRRAADFFELLVLS